MARPGRPERSRTARSSCQLKRFQRDYHTRIRFSLRTPTTTTASSSSSMDSEFEIGSIGIQHGAAWYWGIDTVIPMPVIETQGEGKDRRDCMRQFTAAWDHFAAN